MAGYRNIGVFVVKGKQGCRKCIVLVCCVRIEYWDFDLVTVNRKLNSSWPKGYFLFQVTRFQIRIWLVRAYSGLVLIEIHGVKRGDVGGGWGAAASSEMLPYINVPFLARNIFSIHWFFSLWISRLPHFTLYSNIWIAFFLNLSYSSAFFEISHRTNPLFCIFLKCPFFSY